MPQRFLRPGIRTSARWNTVSRDAQSLFVAIMTVVDDYGRYDGRAAVLCAEAFGVWNDMNPSKAVSTKRCAELCDELHAAKLVIFYKVDGKPCLQVDQWQEKARSNKSKYPPPITEKLQGAAECTQSAADCVQVASNPPPPSPSPSILAITSSTIASADAPIPLAPDEVVSAWNETTLPNVAKMTDSRKAHLHARISEPFFREHWRGALGRVVASDFCRGATDRGNWKATFDWFVTPDAVVKIMEGKYDNGQGAGAARKAKQSKGEYVLKPSEMPRCFNPMTDEDPK